MSHILTELSTSGNSRLPLPEARARNVATILSTIQGHKWTLTSFLMDLFSPDQGNYVTSQMQIQMVSYFLGLCSTFGADDLAEMMYVQYMNIDTPVMASRHTLPLMGGGAC